MKLAAINPTDFGNSIDGVTISVWVQGCPHHCPGCHNKDNWDFDDPNYPEIKDEDRIIHRIVDMMSEEGIEKNLSILGGEPLAPQNENFVLRLIQHARKEKPDSSIYLWTGYSMSELNVKYFKDKEKFDSLLMVDYLITDRFILSRRNLSLSLRGSDNQHIWQPIKKFKFFGKYQFVDITDKIDCNMNKK